MGESAGSDRSEFLTLRGRGTSPGLACGPLLRSHDDLSPEQARGAILVAERAVPDDVSRILSAAGTVTVGGAVLSHMSLLSREFGKPSVSLPAGGPARFVRGGASGLLDLDASEFGPEAPVIEEGDVALVDGDRGVVRIPGAASRDVRLRMRRLCGLLVEYSRNPADGPVLDEIRRSAEDPWGPEIPFLLEAGLIYRLVPEGLPSRKLLAAISSHQSGSGLLESRLHLLRARIVGAAASRRDKAVEGLRASGDPVEVERIAEGAEGVFHRARGLLLDLGMNTGELGAPREQVRAEAANRIEILRSQLRRELAVAMALSRPELEAQAARLYVLVRRAHGTGIEQDSVAAVRARLDERFGGDLPCGNAPRTVPLDDSPVRDPLLVGGKAAGLLEVLALLPEKCRIPRGFIVTSAGYRSLVRGEIADRIRSSLRSGEDLAEVARRARAAILSAELPGEIATGVEAAFRGLVATRLAVRSSSTIEDGPSGSLAGQFDTFLGVRGLPELLNRIRWVWASLWNVGALRAMHAAGIAPLDADQAVLVQEMVETVSAGVLVSRDPARGADALLVNATWGLGEGISMGGVAGDLFWVRRSTGELLATERSFGAKQVALDPRGTGTIETVLPPERAARACLDQGQLARLAALARSLDSAGRAFRDAEFGFAEDGTLLVFQVRSLGSPRSRSRPGR